MTTPFCLCLTLYSKGASATYWAMAVPIAAPLGPIPRVNMQRGSSAALRSVKIRDHFKGVRVSPSPRKMPLETSQSVAAGVPRARMRRYETAGAYLCVILLLWLCVSVLV